MKHAPPAKGVEETVALLSMNETSKSVASLKKAQRASRVSARTKTAKVDEASEDRRIKERAAEAELEKALEFWKRIHGIHGPPDLAPRDCGACADIAKTIGDSKVHPRITSTLERFPRIPSPPTESNIIAPEVPQAMRDSLARREDPNPVRLTTPSVSPPPARLQTIEERSSSSEDSPRPTPAASVPVDEPSQGSVFESDSSGDEEGGNTRNEANELRNMFLTPSILDLTSLDEVRREYLAQRPPSPIPTISTPTDHEETSAGPDGSSPRDAPLVSPTSAEGQAMVASIREYFSLPSDVPFSEIPDRLDALSGYFINDRIVAPRDWENRFDIAMRASEADIPNRRTVEDWIRSIDWWEGREDSDDEVSAEEIPAIHRPVTPRHLNPDPDTSGLHQAESSSPQVAEEGGSPDMKEDEEVSPLSDTDEAGDSSEAKKDEEVSPLSSDEESPTESFVSSPRLYNITTRPRNSENRLAHRPARPSTLRREIILFDEETIDRVRSYKW